MFTTPLKSFSGWSLGNMICLVFDQPERTLRHAVRWWDRKISSGCFSWTHNNPYSIQVCFYTVLFTVFTRSSDQQYYAWQEQRAIINHVFWLIFFKNSNSSTVIIPMSWQKNIKLTFFLLSSLNGCIKFSNKSFTTVIKFFNVINLALIVTVSHWI